MRNTGLSGAIRRLFAKKCWDSGMAGMGLPSISVRLAGSVSPHSSSQSANTP